MRKKFLSTMLVFSMAVAALSGCGTEKNSSNKESSTGKVSSDGKVLNIYCWNEEFKSRVTDYFPNYKKKDATGDNW